MTKKQLLQRIRHQRKKHNISQQQVGDALKMTQPLYSSYETGKADIGLEKFLDICEELGLEVILVEKDNPFPISEAMKTELKLQFSDWLEVLTNG